MTPRDSIIGICKQLVKIDNRPNKELAEATGLAPSTIRYLRNGRDLQFIRSTTITRIAKAMHRTVVVK